MTTNIYSSIRDSQSKNKALGDDTEIKQTCLLGSVAPFIFLYLSIEHFIMIYCVIDMEGGVYIKGPRSLLGVGVEIRFIVVFSWVCMYVCLNGNFYGDTSI